eukprot:COSAG05_NODE_833_length_7066_cov_45.021961_3_plen_391_part_00
MLVVSRVLARLSPANAAAALNVSWPVYLRYFGAPQAQHTVGRLMSSQDGLDAPKASPAPSTRHGARDIFAIDFNIAVGCSASDSQADTLKYHRGMTNGQRGKVSLDFKKAGLWRGKPFKPLTTPKKRTGGRNQDGQICCRHKGGGAKRRYRIIDFKRQLWDVSATVERLEYDPNRSAFIALLAYDNGAMAYILAPQGLRAGDTVVAGKGRGNAGIEARPGNAAPLKFLPVGVQVHNIELLPGGGGKLARSAGASATYQSRTEDGFAVLRMPSKEQRLVPIMCMATVGQVSNPLHSMQKLGKAGASRHRGIRPTVRGVAMNPVDHPLGGGEGKSSGGRPAVTPWGFPCKGGYRTRQRRKPSRSMIIFDRRGMQLPKTLSDRKRLRRAKGKS